MSFVRLEYQTSRNYLQISIVQNFQPLFIKSMLIGGLQNLIELNGVECTKMISNIACSGVSIGGRGTGAMPHLFCLTDEVSPPPVHKTYLCINNIAEIGCKLMTPKRRAGDMRRP